MPTPKDKNGADIAVDDIVTVTCRVSIAMDTTDRNNIELTTLEPLPPSATNCSIMMLNGAQVVRTGEVWTPPEGWEGARAGGGDVES